MKLTNILNANSNKITNVTDPTAAQDVATKNYVDAAVQGYKWKEPVKAASTGNLTLSGTQTVDGVALVANDRILVKNQSTGSQNGIYLVQSGAWTRTTDFDAASELEGATVFVSQGTAGGNTNWQMTTDGPYTIGTTAFVWTQIGGGTSYTQGTGISISGGVIAIDVAVTARKSTFTIGDGAATTYTVTHNLNNTDPTVTVWEAAATGEKVIADVKKVDANSVQIIFGTAPASGAYKVSVVG
jgi:hypothetical protein